MLDIEQEEDLASYIKLIRINNKKKTFSREAYVKRTFPHFYSRLLKETSFLDKNVKIGMRIHYVDINEDILNCPVCHKGLVSISHYKEGKITIFCSSKCKKSTLGKLHSKTKRENTLFAKYGVKNIMDCPEGKDKQLKGCKNRNEVDLLQRRSKTNIKRYGCSNPMNNETIRNRHSKIQGERTKEQQKVSNNKRKNTMLSKYGYTDNFKDPEKKKQFNLTIKEKYGVDNISQNPDIILKKKETHYNKWKINPQKDKDKIIELYLKFKSSTYVADLIGSNYQSVCKLLKESNVPLYQSGAINVSKQEIQIRDFLTRLNIEYVINKRDWTFTNKELDIFIPSLNIGIELNGLYWHSNKFTPKDYHRVKTEIFREQDIRVIHIWEDEWNLHMEKCKLFIKSQLGINEKIFARKTNIKHISSKDTNSFLDKYHFKGGLKNIPIKLGLFSNKDDKLLAVMTFSLSNNVYNLNRFSSNVNVVGGFSKLLSFFNKTININRFPIISFLDLSKFKLESNVYLSTGFKQVSISYGNYWYIESGTKRVSRQKYTKKNIIKRLIYNNIKFSPKCTEFELAPLLNLLWIYGCGNVKYQLTFK